MFQAYLVPIMTDVPFIIGPPLYESEKVTRLIISPKKVKKVL